MTLALILKEFSKALRVFTGQFPFSPSSSDVPLSCPEGHFLRSLVLFTQYCNECCRSVLNWDSQFSHSLDWLNVCRLVFHSHEILKFDWNMLLRPLSALCLCIRIQGYSVMNGIRPSSRDTTSFWISCYYILVSPFPFLCPPVEFFIPHL